MVAGQYVLVACIYQQSTHIYSDQSCTCVLDLSTWLVQHTICPSRDPGLTGSIISGIASKVQLVGRLEAERPFSEALKHVPSQHLLAELVVVTKDLALSLK